MSSGQGARGAWRGGSEGSRARDGKGWGKNERGSNSKSRTRRPAKSANAPRSGNRGGPSNRAPNNNRQQTPASRQGRSNAPAQPSKPKNRAELLAERLTWVTGQSVGRRVKVFTKDGGQLNGTLASHAPAVLHMRLTCGRVIKPGQGRSEKPGTIVPKPGKPPIMVRDYKMMCVENVPVPRVGRGGTTAAGLMTDSGIGEGRLTKEQQEALIGRDLVSASAWIRAPNVQRSRGGGLEDDKQGPSGEWDQFAANRALKDYKKVAYHDELYTTALNQDDFTDEQIRRAEETANAIMAKTSSNAHIREERGQGIDDTLDSEDRYSGVLVNNKKGGATGKYAARGGGPGAAPPPSKTNGQTSWRDRVRGDGASSNGAGSDEWRRSNNSKGVAKRGTSGSPRSQSPGTPKGERQLKALALEPAAPVVAPSVQGKYAKWSAEQKGKGGQTQREAETQQLKAFSKKKITSPKIADNVPLGVAIAAAANANQSQAKAKPQLKPATEGGLKSSLRSKLKSKSKLKATSKAFVPGGGGAAKKPPAFIPGAPRGMPPRGFVPGMGGQMGFPGPNMYGGPGGPPPYGMYGGAPMMGRPGMGYAPRGPGGFGMPPQQMHGMPMGARNMPPPRGMMPPQQQFS